MWTGAVNLFECHCGSRRFCFVGNYNSYKALAVICLFIVTWCNILPIFVRFNEVKIVSIAANKLYCIEKPI